MKSKNAIIGLLIIVVLALGSYICYDKFFNDEPTTDEGEKQTEKKDIINEEQLDANSDFVKELYDMVHVTKSPVDLHDYHVIDGKIIGKVFASDMSDEYKAYYGYRQIPTYYTSQSSYQKMEKCEDFKNVDFGQNIYCGGVPDSYEKLQEYTWVLDESVLKKYVQKVFGEGSYNSIKKFQIPTGALFVYDNNSKYIYADYAKGGTGVFPYYKIESASRYGDTVYIVEEGTYYKGDNFEIESKAKFKLTFKKSSDNYIFDSVERI